ncbi:hypothetical protein [Prosthecobacter vanneervenii]|uniref:Uncharacterized protein n=1 Tax=Prosthecobacter vanneervenii TaxID=48466 RepID=A0A7W7Y8G1_9BACT|nr:hypothetical protein [Prosthecobacter vanneervenii]MBB5031499.1 hypothetical protein [Prosthecobacter vanneervenii]
MNLIQNGRELSERWSATQACWRDARAQEFEKQYLEQLPGLLTKTSAMINELENLLRKIRKDCEPHP